LKTPLRVAILTPTALPDVTGNAITAERWRRHLSQKGVVVMVMETASTGPRDLVGKLDAFRPHALHAHHVTRAAALMLHPRVARKYGDLPLVVSPAGTDLNFYAAGGEGWATVGKVCATARFIISQSPATTHCLQDLLPDLRAKIVYAPKAFSWLGTESFDLRSAAGCRGKEVLFFMPAGIRPVKGNLECLAAMAAAHEAAPWIRVVFAGPGLDPEYTTRFREKIGCSQAFASWIPRIPPEAMQSAYKSADVVLNHSVSEGLSNSLLESIAAGRPILASDIPGNRWLIRDEDGTGPCGCLFDPGDRAGCNQQILRLAGDSALRESLAAGSRMRAAAWPGPAQEAQALVDIYEAARNGRDRFEASGILLPISRC
jgi:glycosyltransferase involved in cell wall biosynthesis